MLKHRSNVQVKEMKKIQTGNWSIVEVGNKHLNGDEFPDFVYLFFFFGIKNVRVGGKILGSVGRSETHIYFFWPNKTTINRPINQEMVINL